MFKLGMVVVTMGRVVTVVVRDVTESDDDIISIGRGDNILSLNR